MGGGWFLVGCSKTAEGYIRVLHTSKMVLCKRGADPDLATRVNVKGVLAKTSFCIIPSIFYGNFFMGERVSGKRKSQF